MELYEAILIKILAKEKVEVLFPNLQIKVKDIVEMECYKMLQQIKDIIESENLSDFECIEKIVCIFEKMGSNGGNRHDFG